MIGSIIKQFSRQIHQIYGSVVWIPIFTEEHYDYHVDKVLGWVDSLSYIGLRVLLIYIAFHFLVKYW